MWFALTQPPYGTSMPQSGRRPQHQTQKWHGLNGISVLPLGADIVSETDHVGKGPATEITTAKSAKKTALLVFGFLDPALVPIVQSLVFLLRLSSEFAKLFRQKWVARVIRHRCTPCEPRLGL
jgi:hypothetical protein